jgi:hypothetical protein
MSSHHEFEGVPEAERRQFADLADRLERDRPVPGARFRGQLGRRLSGGSRGSRFPAALPWQALAGVCSGFGTLCLAVGALGLVGAGPFSA